MSHLLGAGSTVCAYTVALSFPLPPGLTSRPSAGSSFSGTTCSAATDFKGMYVHMYLPSPTICNFSTLGMVRTTDRVANPKCHLGWSSFTAHVSSSATNTGMLGLKLILQKVAKFGLWSHRYTLCYEALPREIWLSISGGKREGGHWQYTLIQG